MGMGRMKADAGWCVHLNLAAIGPRLIFAKLSLSLFLSPSPEPVPVVVQKIYLIDCWTGQPQHKQLRRQNIHPIFIFLSLSRCLLLCAPFVISRSLLELTLERIRGHNRQLAALIATIEDLVFS